MTINIFDNRLEAIEYRIGGLEDKTIRNIESQLEEKKER